MKKEIMTDIDYDIHPKTNAWLLTRAITLLRCTECHAQNFVIYRDDNMPLEVLSHCVVVCQACQTCFKYDKGILEMLQEKPSDLTLAQRTNFWHLVANRYQKNWRNWCMSLFCANKFSNEQEKEKLTDWLQMNSLPSHSVCIDLATSHGFYAITLAEKMIAHQMDGIILAVDFSKKMLTQAVSQAQSAGVSDKILWILADVESAIFSENVASRISCGGSMNEYRHASKVLGNTHTWLNDSGLFFVMNLFARNSFLSAILNIIHRISGLNFFTFQRWNEFFVGNQFGIHRQEAKGVVMFTLLKK
ncbi:class I SAM-dependent methyltransferase [bacterium]|nr:class I SAM-dependent methyltransferase [bacterium]